MRFERMTNDELKRFLLLDVQSLETALAIQEAARRWLAYEQEDVDTESEAAFERGRTEGYDLGHDDGHYKGFDEGYAVAEKEYKK